MNDEELQRRYRWPRRRLIRGFLRTLAAGVFAALTNLNVEGAENFPQAGPLLVVANHFNFADPALMIRVAPWPLEMIGGHVMPNAPEQIWWIARTYGFLPVHRGTGRREALTAAENVLKAGGILGVFPEGQSNAAYLRSPRPGVGFLAARAGCPILPMGFDGTPNIFPRLRKAKRATITVRVGKPFGPLTASGTGPEHRRQLDEIGHEIMRHIAALIPPERHGIYALDAAQRAAAQAGNTWDF